VLEDDAHLTAAFPVVATAAAAVLHQGDVALLERRGTVEPAIHGRVLLPEDHELIYVHRREPWGGVATLVTRRAATRLATFGKPVRSAPDDWSLFSKRVVLRAVTPPIAWHDDAQPSEIGREDRFPVTLDAPSLLVRLKWKARHSRVWSSRAGRELRDAALFARCAANRSLP
jgi:hypothetical protein